MAHFVQRSAFENGQLLWKVQEKDVRENSGMTSLDVIYCLLSSKSGSFMPLSMRVSCLFIL